MSVSHDKHLLLPFLQPVLHISEPLYNLQDSSHKKQDAHNKELRLYIHEQELPEDHPLPDCNLLSVYCTQIS